MTEDALPLPQSLSQDKRSESTKESTPGGQKWPRWEVVAVVNGLARAEIVRGRLESKGIPSRIQQDSGGGMLAVTVGAMGQAKILVPAPLAEQALKILDIEPP
jgi:hypothetical protein